MAEAGEHILAVDLGTSGPKVALVSARGKLLAVAFEPVGLILSPGGGAEQDPDDWWRAIVKAARRVIEDSGLGPKAVGAICCTAQWSGTVPVGADGQAVYNAVIWMDSRGAADIRELTGGWVRLAGYAPRKALRWIRLTGGAPAHSGKDPLAHILWLRRERPEAYARVHQFLEPKDYLNLRLTGRFAAAIDSIALHWLTDNRDLERVHYDPTLLAWAGIEPEKLPELKQTTDVLGPLCEVAAADLGLEPGLPVVMGTPDLQSAAIGSGAVADYEAHLYIGTSSWLTCHVPFKKTDVLHNMASLPSAIPGRYFVADEQEVAGKAIEYLLGEVLFCDDALGPGPAPNDVYERLERLVAAAPAGSGKLVFAPWLYGERTPVEDHTLRGGWFNLSLSTTRAELARSVMEGVAYNSRWLLGYLEKFIGRRLSSIALIGGGARSAVWGQIFADVLERPVKQMADPLQANVRGAALLGSVAMGWIGFQDIPGLVEVARVFEPDPDHRAIYSELYGAFREIHKRNRGLYARLNRRA